MRLLDEVTGQRSAVTELLKRQHLAHKGCFILSGPGGCGISWTLTQMGMDWERYGGVALKATGAAGRINCAGARSSGIRAPFFNAQAHAGNEAVGWWHRYHWPVFNDRSRVIAGEPPSRALPGGQRQAVKVGGPLPA